MGPRTPGLSGISKEKLRKVFVSSRGASARIPAHISLVVKGRLMRKVWLIVFCAAVLLFACQPSAPKTEFKAVANTQDVMESLVAHMAQNIWDAVKVEIDEKGTHHAQPQA